VHAEWHGMTAADLVFPFFLLVVGLAIPLALDRPGAAPTWGKLLRRAALLIAIGIALNWLIRPSALEDLRLTGVLQRIGVVYLACAAVAMLSRGYRVALIGATGLLVAHGVCLLVIAAPGAAAPSLAPGLGLSGWLDQVALPGRVLRKTYDPEGVLSTLSAIASGLIGLATMRWLNRVVAAQQAAVDAELRSRHRGARACELGRASSRVASAGVIVAGARARRTR
jgi:predicted acyltransferase